MNRLHLLAEAMAARNDLCERDGDGSIPQANWDRWSEAMQALGLTATSADSDRLDVDVANTLKIAPAEAYVIIVDEIAIAWHAAIQRYFSTGVNANGLDCIEAGALVAVNRMFGVEVK